MKRLFTLIILLVVILSKTAYANTFTDINKEPYLEEAVDVLSSYNIINGYPDNTFKPDQAVTRAEMAKIVIVAAGYFEYSKNMTSTYEDMRNHWAESYVELASVRNIIKGVSENNYNPDNEIKFEEATTMILRLLGYTDESLPGEWPDDYYIKATELNLFHDINALSEYATRRDVAIMLYNALNCKLVEVRENNTINYKKETLLSLNGKVKSEEITLNHLKNNYDYSNYLFNKWNVYYDNDDKIVLLNNPSYDEYNGTVTSVLSNRVIFMTDDNGNVKVFQLPNIPIVINKAPGSYESLLHSKVKVVYKNQNNTEKLLGIIASKPTEVALVDKNNLYKQKSSTFLGLSLPTNTSGSVNYNKIYVNGDASSLEEIKTNDLIYIYETEEAVKSTLTLEVVRNQVEGHITKIETYNNINYYTIDNKTYKTGKYYIPDEYVNLNDYVKVILDKDNNIAKINILAFGKEPSTYGIVLSSSHGTNNNAVVKILDQYGSTTTYYLAPNSSVVNAVESDSSINYMSSLKRNDIVKFDPVSSGNLKIIDYKQPQFIKTNYYEESKKLANGYKISQNTLIVYESNGKYQFLKPDQLGSYVEGKILVNDLGHVDVLFLTSGIKSATNVKPTPETSQNFSGTAYGIIEYAKKIDSSTSQVKLFNNSNIFSVSNTSSAGTRVNSSMNTYIKVVVSNGEITSLERLLPETEKIKISAVYSDQLQIDGITYIEYASNIKVYSCTTDSSGNIIKVTAGSKSDIQPGAKAQLYDIYGNFDGIIDLVLLFN